MAARLATSINNRPYFIRSSFQDVGLLCVVRNSILVFIEMRLTGDPWRGRNKCDPGGQDTGAVPGALEHIITALADQSGIDDTPISTDVEEERQNLTAFIPDALGLVADGAAASLHVKEAEILCAIQVGSPQVLPLNRTNGQSRTQGDCFLLLGNFLFGPLFVVPSAPFAFLTRVKVPIR